MYLNASLYTVTCSNARYTEGTQQMLVGCMKDGKHGSRLRGMKEGRSEWIGTEGAEPGTGSRGRGPRSDRSLPNIHTNLKSFLLF